MKQPISDEHMLGFYRFIMQLWRYNDTGVSLRDVRDLLLQQFHSVNFDVRSFLETLKVDSVISVLWQ